MRCSSLRLCSAVSVSASSASWFLCLSACEVLMGASSFTVVMNSPSKSLQFPKISVKVRSLLFLH